jgi:hypothetical protein
LLKRTGIYPFWVSFIKALIKHKEKLCPPDADDRVKSGYKEVVQACLKAVIPQWHAVVATPYYATRGGDKVSRIMELIELCIDAEELIMCRSLLGQVASHKASVVDNFRQLFSPLVKRLHPWLEARKLDIASSPFLETMQAFIARLGPFSTIVR